MFCTPVKNGYLFCLTKQECISSGSEEAKRFSLDEIQHRTIASRIENSHINLKLGLLLLSCVPFLNTILMQKKNEMERERIAVEFCQMLSNTAL